MIAGPMRSRRARVHSRIPIRTREPTTESASPSSSRASDTRSRSETAAPATFVTAGRSIARRAFSPTDAGELVGRFVPCFGQPCARRDVPYVVRNPYPLRPVTMTRSQCRGTSGRSGPRDALVSSLVMAAAVGAFWIM